MNNYNQGEAWMELNVDLRCSDCFKSIKKILAEFSEIHDQVYEREKNMVTVKAVCCCPEKLREDLYRRGKNVIRSIEIVRAPPPQGGVAVGVPIAAKYFPFPLGYGCPGCPGDNVSCPFCHGNGMMIPQPSSAPANSDKN